MRKKHIATIVLSMFALVGCSEFLGDADSMDIDVDRVLFDFPATVEGSGSAGGEAVNSFTTFRTLDISDIGSRRVTEFADIIIGLEVERASLIVSALDNREYLIKNLSVMADVPDSPQVIETTLTGRESVAGEGMRNFIREIVSRLVAGDEVVVSISGHTDAPADTRLNIDLESAIEFFADPQRVRME
ncbi:MAG: hypothetical protein LBV18_02830 [Alistipes sp.]|jgi:hypothetical protein|nr:hypothetical protein [Alistipes sp.]